MVLSACDTADGKPTGDGVLGLSSAFLVAGVPSVVVAQWSIPDAPTALLMHAFYRKLGMAWTRHTPCSRRCCSP